MHTGYLDHSGRIRASPWQARKQQIAINHMKSLQIIGIAAILCLCLHAPVRAADGQNSEVAIYNSGRVHVQETRSIVFPESSGRVTVTDLPGTLVPSSFRLAAPGVGVQAQAFHDNPITEQNLLDRYVGKDVTVVLPDPADAQARVTRKGRLLSNVADPVTGVSKPVLLVDGKVYLGFAEAIILPGVPDDLTASPAMVLAVTNSGKTRKAAQLSYDFDGMSWRAIYNVTLAGNGADLRAWAEVVNDTDTAFSGASVHLVAGEVRQQSNRMVRAKGAPMAMALDTEAAPPDAAGASFAEYRIYRIPFPLDIAPKSEQLVALFAADDVKVVQELSGTFYAEGRVAETAAQPLDFTMTIHNTKENGLGRPLPGGVVQAVMSTADGVLLPVGEASMPHVAEGGEARLTLGRAFDVTVSRVQTGYRKIGKTTVEVDWEITLTNGGDAARNVVLKEVFSGEWTVLDASSPARKADARTMEFQLKVPSAKDGGKAILNYSARIVR